MIGEQLVLLPPEIAEAREAQAAHAEQVLEAPHEGELERNLLDCVLDGLVEHLDIESIAEIGVVQEPVNTEQPGAVDREAVVHAAVVLHLEAERSKGAVLPEVEAAGDLEVGAARRDRLPVKVLGVVVVVHEEEGVAPVVVVETFQGRGHVLAIRTEVIEHLQVGLGLCSLSKQQRGGSHRHQEYFFHLMGIYRD